VDELLIYKRPYLYVEGNQLAMIYAASAYGVGRAKDKNQGDFWKHNDISRAFDSVIGKEGILGALVKGWDKFKRNLEPSIGHYQRKSEYERDSIIGISCPLWGTLEICNVIYNLFRWKHSIEVQVSDLIIYTITFVGVECDQGYEVGITSSGGSIEFSDMPYNDRFCFNTGS